MTSLCRFKRRAHIAPDDAADKACCATLDVGPAALSVKIVCLQTGRRPEGGGGHDTRAVADTTYYVCPLVL